MNISGCCFLVNGSEECGHIIRHLLLSFEKREQTKEHFEFTAPEGRRKHTAVAQELWCQPAGTANAASATWYGILMEQEGRQKP
jgi:hypothetical protein